jgi:hypothetical protein
MFGGVLATAISAAWQRRSQRHSVRLMLSQEILKTYHQYLRYLKRNDNYEDTEEFDQLHSDMLSKCGMAKVLFGEELAIGLQKLAAKLANIQNLRLQAHNNQRPKTKRAFEKNFTEVMFEARQVIEEMFNVLK